MKNYNNLKKFLLVCLTISIVCFALPQVAFASWWNPFSWNVWKNIFHKADTKTQVLENKVKELETKLNEQNSATPVASDTEEAVDVKPKKESSQQSVKQVQQVAPVKITEEIVIQQQTLADAEVLQQAEQDKLNLLAERAKEEQEAQAKVKQAEQDKLAKIEAEKLQLQSLVSLQLSNFNQQKNEITSQISSKKSEINAIKTEYNAKIASTKNALASMAKITAMVAKLTEEMNTKLQPLVDEYNTLVNEYNVLIGAPLQIQNSQSSIIPQYLTFYPNGNGGGDLYGNDGAFHLKVEQTSYGFKIY
jgi:chromosome segregation ATPase